MRLDREQLALVIPLVKRSRLIEPFIALQADQFGGVHGGKRLGHLGLADTRFTFQQKRAPQQLHQRDRRRQFAIGNISCCAKRLRDLVTRLQQAASTPRFFAAAQLRQ